MGSIISLFSAIDATWPPASTHRIGDVFIREGAGGGCRVSAATAAILGTAPSEADLSASALAMRGLGQDPLFMVRSGEDALDEALAARGYGIISPVALLSIPARTASENAPTGLTALTCETLLARQAEIWRESGIGPARLAVMARVTGPRTYLIARHDDRSAGTAFLACDGAIAMVHALEICPHARRNGLGQAMMRKAAQWAVQQRAETLAVLVTRDNRAAMQMYQQLGMTEVAQYHYRGKS